MLLQQADAFLIGQRFERATNWLYHLGQNGGKTSSLLVFFDFEKSRTSLSMVIRWCPESRMILMFSLVSAL
ncbi:hypothetical protein OK016_21195 [Vibrio chagasii]|nr:hypothetical protein [Vibrio chagasii]